jgi:hypothetical protein
MPFERKLVVAFVLTFAAKYQYAMMKAVAAVPIAKNTQIWYTKSKIL